MLKQPQYQPMPMEEQVVAIFAATPPEGRSSWVREYPVSDIGRYEREMLAYVRSQHPQILAQIKATGKLEDDVRKSLEAALDAFAKIFQPSRREEAAA
jgi:F-type H+-transporting ATPase subunit alpha